jgi:hypothetical protein
MVAKKTIHADEMVCPQWAPIAQPIASKAGCIDRDDKRIAESNCDLHRYISLLLYGTRRLCPPSRQVRQPGVIVSVCYFGRRFDWEHHGA